MKRIAAGILAFILAAAAQAGPWPTDNITTTHVDQSTDDPSQARAEIYNTMLRVKDMIGARGSASGVAQLDASGLVPLANIPATLTGKSADTLDGIDSPSFARRDAANTFTAAATFSGGITTTTINATGAATLSGGITTSNSNMHIDPAPGTGATYLNYFSGTGGVVFGNGGSSGVAAWSSAGKQTQGTVPLPRLTAADGGGYPQSGTGGEMLRIIRGTVTGGGMILRGSGFTAVRNSVGNQTVTLQTAFSAPPTVVVTSVGSTAIPGVYSETASGFQVVTVGVAGSLGDYQYSFIAVGPP